MRDILPADMLRREEMLDIVRETFRLWGFSPISTPAIEFREVLAGKYGEMADRLIYTLEHDDGLALRYDLTVPLSRVIAMYDSEFPKPFKRYQIQEVWRAERAQPRQGRFREFLQCDVDSVGSDSLTADAEILALSAELLKKLKLPGAVTRINHRAMLRGLMEVCGFPSEKEIDICRTVDKLDKIGRDGVRKQLLDEDYSEESVDRLLEIIQRTGSTEELLDSISGEYGDNQRISRGIDELREVISRALDFGAEKDSLELSLSLSRGLDYYTGTIYESYLPEQPQIGSLTGGGRYDNLIGIFAGRDIPAVGITIGVDRILAALSAAGQIESRSTPTRVMVTVFDQKLLPDSVRLAARFRNRGIPAEVYLDDKRLGKQFSYADRLDIPFVVILGEEEIKRDVIALKHMKSGEQTECSFVDAAARILENG